MPNMLRLPVVLTDTEKLSVGADLSAALVKQGEAEAKKKEAMKVHNEEIKTWKVSVANLNTSLITGTIEREIEVKEEEDLFAGVVRTVRMDTLAVVKERALDPEERQLKLGDKVLAGGVVDLAAERDKRSEEQALAGSPEEAEAMREARIAEEKATQAFDSLTTGADVEILIGEEWIRFAVENKTDYSFEANNRVYDVSKHGISWRLKPTWSDLVAVSEEAARLAEIDRLAAEQAADKPKALLKAPRKKNGEPKSIKVQDEKGNPIIPPAETQPSDDHPANGGPGDGLVF